MVGTFNNHYHVSNAVCYNFMLGDLKKQSNCGNCEKISCRHALLCCLLKLGQCILKVILKADEIDPRVHVPHSEGVGFQNCIIAVPKQLFSNIL